MLAGGEGARVEMGSYVVVRGRERLVAKMANDPTVLSHSRASVIAIAWRAAAVWT